MSKALTQPFTVSSVEFIWFLHAERERGAISFREAVYLLVSYIPQGYVLGYGQVAGFIGSPRAARQVGFALGALPPERIQVHKEDCIPWWRVIRTNGQIALRGDSIRPNEQVALLRGEGVDVLDYKVNMNQFAWQPERSID